MTAYKSAPTLDEVYDLAAADAGTQAPAGAKWGIDRTTGQAYYPDALGAWTAVPVAVIDVNASVESQAGGDYLGGGAAAPPANPDDGDVHIETYDDRIVYWVAAGGVFPAAPQAQFAASTSSLTANPDGSFTHDNGAGGQTTIPAHVPSSLTANVDGSFTHDNGAGVQVGIPAPAAGADVGQAVVVDNGNNTGTVTGTDTAGAVTTDTFISALNKVTPAGQVTPLDPALDCVPEAAFQSIIDHHATEILAAGCDGNPLTLNRSLTIGADHVAADTIGVSHADSDDAAVAGVTTHHTHAVLASQTSSATSPGVNPSAVIGSRDSTASGPVSTVGAAVRGDTSGFASAILGGVDNVNTADTSAIIGGINNNVTGARSVIIGGENNVASGNTAVVLGGRNNVASGVDSIAMGVNSSATANQAFAGGSNNVQATGVGSFAYGNENVLASGQQATAFGRRNTASGLRAFVSGGIDNVASGEDSWAGGQGSTASNTQAIAFGFQCTASGDDSAAFNGLSVADDPRSFAISGGQATTGVSGTFSHGNGTATPGIFNGAVPVGFRGAAPAPARALVTLADVILALQEQGLAV